jgi:hypothetical protein
MFIPHPIRADGPLRLEDSLWRAAHWVWERRETAKHQNFAFSEETITETILLDLATLHSNEIRVLPFNKPQEAKTGADWEWCFYNRRGNSFVQMLIQAKVLDDSDKDYAHIDRFIGNSRVRQIDRLLATARRRNVPAMYVFYNHVTDTNRVPRDACRCSQCYECWGCSTALADAVHAELPDKSYNTLREISRPWLCLLCPQPNAISPAPSAPDRALGTLWQLRDISAETFRRRDRLFDAPKLPDEPTRQPPSYFERLQDIARIENPVERGIIIDEIAADNPGVEGIVLVTDAAVPDELHR